MIAIVDYGMGNVRSLRNALEFLGAEVLLTANPDELRSADGIVLPGVGAFDQAIGLIKERGLKDVLDEIALQKLRPVLGICLGMQLFASRSEELGTHNGLSWVQAEVVRLPVTRPLKVPHVGWNEIKFNEEDWLFRGIDKAQANFYFVHSFCMVCENSRDVVATTEYGGDVTAVIRRGKLIASQFHPEKSQDNGLIFLRNWLGFCFENDKF